MGLEDPTAKVPTKITRMDTGETLTVQCTLKRNHTGTVKITDHPVEEGANVSDHLRTQPRKFSMEGFVSDIEPSGEPGDVAQAAFFLNGLIDNPGLVELTSRLMNYTSMAMGNIVMPEEAKLGKAFQFTADLQYFRVVGVGKTLRNTKLGAKAKKGKAPEEQKKPEPKASFWKRAKDEVNQAGGVGNYVRNKLR